MVEGMYWFFAPANENKVDRHMMTFELPTEQDFDIDEPAATLLAQNVWFSPVYKMEAKNNDANVTVPLTMYNWYATALLTFKNTGTSEINLEKIILETKKPLVYKGKIDPSLIASNFTLVYEDGEWVDKTDDDGESTNAEKPMEVDYANAASVKKNSVFMVNCPLTIGVGETVTVKMLMPYGDAGSITYKLMNDEGNVAVVKHQEAVKFNHHAQKAVFGVKNGKAVAKNIKLSDFDDDVVLNYAQNNDDIITILNSNSSAVAINKVGDWTLNAEVIEAISSYVSDVTFIGDALVLESATDEAITLANLTNGFTLKSGKLAVAGHDQAITVEGGELELVDSEDDEALLEFKTITNKGGSIKISNPIKVKSIVNQKGTLTFAADQTIDALDKDEKWEDAKSILTLTNGYYTSSEDYSVGKIVIEEGAEVVLAKNGTENNNVFVNSKGSTLEVKGNFIIRQDYVKAAGSAPEKGFKNNGTLTVTGKVAATDAFLNNGTISDSGNVVNVKNAGSITMASGKRLTLTAQTGTFTKGKVNNTADGIILGETTFAQNEIYFEHSTGLTNNLMIDDEEELDAPRAVNTIKLTAGTWEINEDVFVNAKAISVGGAGTVMIQRFDKVIFAGADLVAMENANILGTEVEIASSSDWSGETTEKVTVKNLTIKQSATLTLDYLKLEVTEKIAIWANKNTFAGTGKLVVEEGAEYSYGSFAGTTATASAAGTIAETKKTEGQTDSKYNVVIK